MPGKAASKLHSLAVICCCYKSTLLSPSSSPTCIARNSTLNLFYSLPKVTSVKKKISQSCTLHSNRASIISCLITSLSYHPLFRKNSVIITQQRTGITHEKTETNRRRFVHCTKAKHSTVVHNVVKAVSYLFPYTEFCTKKSRKQFEFRAKTAAILQATKK